MIVSRLAPCRFNLGKLLEGQRGFEEAVRSYRRAVELEPTAVTTLTSLGILLVEAGTGPAAAAEAETLFRSVLELEPDHAVALCNLGKTALPARPPPPARLHARSSVTPSACSPR